MDAEFVDLTAENLADEHFSIVTCSSKYLKFSIILHNNQMRMTARYDQTKEGRFQIRMLNIVSRYMSLYMMHANQWEFFRICDCFRLCNPNKKRPNQTRSIGYTNGIQDRKSVV